jgi:hypothetical protein
MTVQEFTNRAADIKRAEFDAKQEELRRGKGTGSAELPAAVARSCGDDLSMIAVYGIGRNLRADFGYRGASITAAAGDRADMGGWAVEELTPTRAVMVKRQGKKVTRCPVYLAAATRDFSTPPSSPRAASEVAPQVPPITPMAAAQPAVGGSK